MIEYVERKSVNWTVVQNLLARSADLNKWTNFGPVVCYLENQIHQMLEISNDLEVVCCASGTAALNALIGLHEYLQGRKLKWVVSSFGFYCTKQGLLLDAWVVDCDEHGLLDMTRLPDEYDGLVVTNVFGASNTLNKYHQNGKIVIIDSATAFDSASHGPNEIISFHHTKPWGFGEGGCAIILKEHVNIFKTIINFGSVSDYSNNVSGNGKLSDVGAAFISQRLNDIPNIRPYYEYQYSRIANIGIKNGLRVLNNKLTFYGLAPNIPFLAPSKIMNVCNSFVKLQKYYRPLKNTPVATNLFEHIICFPCHAELVLLSDDEINYCFREILNL